MGQEAIAQKKRWWTHRGRGFAASEVEDLAWLSPNQIKKFLSTSARTRPALRNSGRSGRFHVLQHLRAMDFIVLSHLRWNFVYQRPQHIMSRFAAHHRVFFWEEPQFDSTYAFLEMCETPQGVHCAIPHLPPSLSETERNCAQEALLRDLIQGRKLQDLILWYYNPMAIYFTRHLDARAVIYDCMDELSAFRGAPTGLHAAEAELFEEADLVFTGGESLYRAKKLQHNAVYCCPSSIDRDFFHTARKTCPEPADQSAIAHPRLGYSGVIDERMNMELLHDIASLRPDWNLVMLGPVVKISETDLPQAPNIHWLGAKQYSDLPCYMSTWDVGLLPFALNESTRFISPTKTPEYLAAGLPVVSTSITDVVRPYGRQGLVEIADSATDFVASAERAIRDRNNPKRLAKVDHFLAQISWDVTWHRMATLVGKVASDPQSVPSNRRTTGLGLPLPSAA